jgi:hypothetical protein
MSDTDLIAIEEIYVAKPRQTLFTTPPGRRAGVVGRSGGRG